MRRCSIGILLLTLLFFLLWIPAFSQAPTIPASGLNSLGIDGDRMRLTWTSGNGTRRIVVASAGNTVTAQPVNGQSYTSNTSFPLAFEMQPGQRVIYDGSGNLVDVTGLQHSTEYTFRIYEYNGSGATATYLTAVSPVHSRFTLTPPTVQASNISFTNVAGNTMTINCTPGNGTRRLIVIRQGTPVAGTPTDLLNYSESSTFGSGMQISAGSYVVYDNTGTSVVVTNLQPSTAYHVAIFEFNGITGPVYLSSSPATGSVITAAQPTNPSSFLGFNSIEGNSMRLTWTSGNGTRRIVVARVGPDAVSAIPANGFDYVENGNINLGAQILPGQHVVYDGTGNFADVSGLSPGTNYQFAIYEYDGTGASIAYLTTPLLGTRSTASAPIAGSSLVTFSAVLSNSMTVSWTNGNGARRLVLMRAGSAVDGMPANLINYNESSVFGVGGQVGAGNYAVYDGTGNSVTVTGLSASTDYHIAIFEYNGFLAPVYLTSAGNFAIGNQITGATPTTPASGLTFPAPFIEGNSLRLSWNNGNGARRIVVARAGSPVIALPVNGVDYAENSNFNLGEQLSPGQVVVYDGNGSFADVTGLFPGITYHFRVYEYGGSGAGISYLTSPVPNANQSTLVAPSMQSSSISTTGLTSSTVNLSWTNGNGARRIMLMSAGNPVSTSPTNFTSYAASATFGTGTQIGSDNYVVFNSTGSSVSISSLSPNTVYHVAVFEYNGSTGPVYNQSSPLVFNFTTAILPITWGNFSAVIRTNQVIVTWSTLSESNASHYVIEKSSRNNNFVAWDSVKAIGNSSNEVIYSYTDKSPFDGICFYRIRQVDNDGAFSYSKIIQVNFISSFPVIRYRNPVRIAEGLRIELSKYRGTNRKSGSSWTLYDMNGKLIQRRKITSRIIAEDLPNGLTSGIYVLEIDLNGSIHRFRILIY